MKKTPMKKILFVDRDGTLIKEPADQQIDSLDKLEFVDHVICALFVLQSAGYRLVMITNQDGLGTSSYPQDDFDVVQNKLLSILSSQGITFDDILICPHHVHEGCGCRKPDLDLVVSYLKDPQIDWSHSYMVGDRDCDLELARRMGITGYGLVGGGHSSQAYGWLEIKDLILNKPRRGQVVRHTKETHISIEVRLDEPDQVLVNTPYGFLTHMLEQIGCHGQMGLVIDAKGDEHVDEHHLIEDTALALGEALRQALGDKIAINRYAFALPMDESAAEVLMDLSDRPYFVFCADDLKNHRSVGGLAVEMFEHFFRSLSTSLSCNLHMKVTGENAHHMVEGLFKALARCLKQAISRSLGSSERASSRGVPSTKGSL